MTETRNALTSRLGILVAGAVFLVSGASLLVYVLTGAPLPLVLGVLAVAAAVAIAIAVWPDEARRRGWLRRIAIGAPVGLLATGAYDLSRYVLVQVLGFHVSPFKAFPLFGQALLMDDAGRGPVVFALGIAFHALNGVMFGCAYAVWFGHRPWWWGIGFALGLEAFMLAIYPGWLDIRALGEFTTMSVFGHVVYGTVLGLGNSLWLRRRAARERETVAAGP